MKRYALYAIRYTIVLFLIGNLIGCDAFVRKFTRKSKREPKKEEMVLAPEEYKPPVMTREEVYRKHFLFWKSWHDELINTLAAGLSYKKQIDCMNETLKNLELLRATLEEIKQKQLDVYINQLNDLKDSITRDLYGSDASRHRLNAERIKRGILRDFSYPKIKNHLV
ncbi:MAG: hypothetical protein V1884_00225 [Candidatus Omnitrophota bacterium]